MHVDFGVVLSEAVAYEVAVVVQAVDAVVAVAAVVVPARFCAVTYPALGHALGGRTAHLLAELSRSLECQGV